MLSGSVLGLPRLSDETRLGCVADDARVAERVLAAAAYVCAGGLVTRRQVGVVAVSVAALLALSSCGGGSSASPKHHARLNAFASSTTVVSPPVAPETGLVDPGGQSLGRPALWVKIENTPPARPQAGLSVADVVYEEVTEGGITRFVALFNSLIPDVVGPIRSVRVMDPDVVAPVGGVFVYSGGIQPTVDLINAAPVNAVDETNAGGAMFRDTSRSAPHNLYGRGPALVALGAKPLPIPPLFGYLPPGAQFVGDPVESLTVGYDPGYAVSYAYDAASTTWRRSMDGAPFVDTSGQQIAPANVIVQFVACCLDGYEGARYQTVGSGDAWVFSAGRVMKGRWQRDDRSQVTRLVGPSRNPIALTPGRTWVEFVPVGDTVDVVSAPPLPTTTTTRR
jgi:hypothetical protein